MRRLVVIAALLAASPAFADGLTDIPEYTHPCEAPLLDRRAYMETVMWPKDPKFYTFYRIRRNELCGDPVLAPGYYVPAVPVSRWLPPLKVDRPVRPPSPLFPYPCMVWCDGGGGNPPPVTPPWVEPPPSEVPVPLPAVLLGSGVGAIGFLKFLKRRKRRSQ